MKKKIDQFFIENFRSWAGKNYFDLNNINFLFGSNSSGKSSIIHALSLIRQSLSNETFDNLNSITHLRPIGEFTDLGTIKNQAFSIVKNNKKIVSDEISFGYRVQDIENFLKLLKRSHPFDRRKSSDVEDYKKLRLFKGIKEITISYNFLSSTGQLKSIKMDIDNEQILKIFSEKSKIFIDLPKDEAFWRGNLGLNKIPKGEKFYEFLNTHALGAEEIASFNQTELYLKTENDLIAVENEIRTLEAEFIKRQDTYKIIQEALNVLIIIKNKSKYRFEKNKDKIIKELPDQFKQKYLLEDFFMNDFNLYDLFSNNKSEILEIFQSKKDSYDLRSELINIRSLVQELIEQLIKFQKFMVDASYNFSKLNFNSDFFDLNYGRVLENIIKKFKEAKILNLDDFRIIGADSSELNEDFVFPYFEITMLLFGLQKNSNFETQVKNLMPQITQETFGKAATIPTLHKQKDFYQNKLKEIDDQTAKFDKLLGKETISFENFLDLVNKGSIPIFENYEEDLSLSKTILRLSRKGVAGLRDRPKTKNNNLIENLPFFINNNSILPNSSIFIVMRELHNNFFKNFRNLRVIGPHRRRPNRIELINPFEINHNVGVEGQNILNILRNADKKDLDELNKRLKTLDIPYSVSTQFRKEDNSIKVLVKDNNGLVTSLADVGYGVGQILPIVLECVLSRNKLLTIEQPELHLHPKLQANLTDLIIWSSQSNKNRFILETHSEHMILRLKRRLRENFEKEDQRDPEVESLTNEVTINVITTNLKEPKSQNKLLKITPSGNFNGDWPEGFFEERFVELGLD